ncbi:hypothetical protein GCM10007876_09100 [Litoribrevibacter albus]|uniref:Solute-binding protein family 3/N-terminal domain-containing protein n=2 Tax=Litoribrevibacter albus TaxID=1473156 RepID=A0AA37W4T6_9GAMM|nr:hypothetical protein GCM10007876_09100 [Litoribrevibacter albus]
MEIMDDIINTVQDAQTHRNVTTSKKRLVTPSLFSVPFPFLTRFLFITSLLISSFSWSNGWSNNCTSLSVAGSDQWIPFAYADSQKPDHPIGIAFDVVRLLTEDLGLELTFQARQPWKRIEQKMNTGHVDILAGNYWNEERAQKWAITDAISKDEVRVFVHRQNEFPFHELKDLKDRHGLIPSGVSFGQAFDHYKSLLNIKEVKTHSQMMAMLSLQRTDYIVLPYFNTQRKIHALGYQDKIVALPTPLDVNNVHLSLSKQSPCYSTELLQRFNESIRRLKQAGSIQKIEANYLNSSAEAKIPLES